MVLFINNSTKIFIPKVIVNDVEYEKGRIIKGNFMLSSKYRTEEIGFYFNKEYISTLILAVNKKQNIIRITTRHKYTYEYFLNFLPNEKDFLFKYNYLEIIILFEDYRKLLLFLSNYI